MSQAVMISIQPKWCALIASGKKTVEVRKTAPKLETPFKCYIYCTKAKNKRETLTPVNDIRDIRNGTVIGEFVCDEVAHLNIDSVGVTDGNGYYLNERGWNPCLSREEVIEYCGVFRPYGLHISNLKIYDIPKKIRDFKAYRREHRIVTARFQEGDCELVKAVTVLKPIVTAPQSWCYCQELKDAD